MIGFKRNEETKDKIVIDLRIESAYPLPFSSERRYTVEEFRIKEITDLMSRKCRALADDEVRVIWGTNGNTVKIA